MVTFASVYFVVPRPTLKLIKCIVYSLLNYYDIHKCYKHTLKSLFNTILNPVY